MNANYQTIVNSDDIVDYWLQGSSFHQVVTDDTAQIDEYNQWSSYFGISNNIKFTRPSALEPDQFVEHCVGVEGWNMPEKYQTLDMEQWLFAKVMEEKQNAGVDFVYNSEEWMRVEQELTAYRERGLLPMLQFLVYMVDTMRENSIVWGVGRGSSVASYVLYLIGIHKINSMKYNLDIREFLK